MVNRPGRSTFWRGSVGGVSTPTEEDAPGPPEQHHVLSADATHADAVLRHLLQHTEDLVCAVRVDREPPVVVAASAALERFLDRRVVDRTVGAGALPVVERFLLDAVQRAAETGEHRATGQYRHHDAERTVGLHWSTVPGSDGALVLQRMADVAPQIAGGVEHSVLEALLAAGAEERRRMARHLHDDTVQVLAALAIRLEPLTRRGSAASEATAVQRELQALAGRLRTLLSDLDPAAVARHALGDALDARLRAEADRCGVVLEVTDELADEPADVAETLYRIGTEAVLNALRHGAPSHVEVCLRPLRGGYGLQVSDDGRGFAPTDPTPRGRYGLISMRARARRLGGSVGIASEPGAGTTVSVWLPAGLGARTEMGPEARAIAEAGEALLRIESDHQQVWLASPVAQLVCTPAGRLRRVNPAAEALLGRPDAELGGAHLPSLVPERARAAFLDALEAVQEGFDAQRQGRTAVHDGVRPVPVRFHVRSLPVGTEPPWPTLVTLLPVEA